MFCFLDSSFGVVMENIVISLVREMLQRMGGNWTCTISTARLSRMFLVKGTRSFSPHTLIN